MKRLPLGLMMILALSLIIFFSFANVHAVELSAQPGNSVKYRLMVSVDSDNDFLRIMVSDALSQSFTGSVEHGLDDIDWIKMEILEVSGSSANIKSTISALGHEKELSTFWASTTSNNFLDFLIPTDLNIGDNLGRTDYGTVRVVDILKRQYDGETRDVFKLESKKTSNDGGNVIETIVTRYHDKTTGILLEADFRMTLANVILGSVNAEFNIKAIETSLPILSTGGGGGCLIATATYGSELAPQVQILREIRDNSLLQTQSGQTFMQSFNEFYYSFSPIIADYERENPLFKETVKITITPLLTSLSILNNVEIDSESEVLGYGIGIILMNVGMYFVAPAILVMKIRQRF